MGTFVSAYSSHSYGVSPLQNVSASSAYGMLNNIDDFINEEYTFIEI